MHSLATRFDRAIYSRDRPLRPGPGIHFMTQLDSGSQSPDPVLARLARGEESALGELLERHWRALVGYASRLLESADQAQDVAQEAFVRLWERRTQWTGDDAVRPILFRIARNLII